MSDLPIPAKQYFEDFSSSVLEYEVHAKGAAVGKYRGLSNSNKGEKYISFLMEDDPHIEVGNVLATSDGLEKYCVKRIEYDRYLGKAELLNAYV